MIKKRLFIIPLIILFFSACFSPWQGDEGTLTLHLGSGNSGRLAVSPDEQNSLEYTITLTSPGQQPITRTFAGGTTASFEVSPGTWNVTVKGTGNRPMEYSYWGVFPETMLRAYGEGTVDVKSGGNTNAVIKMFPATEAATGEQLFFALLSAASGKKEYVFVTDNIELPDEISIPGESEPGESIFPVLSERDIELRAERPVTIRRTGSGQAELPLFIIEGGRLTLGKKGESNKNLQISGEIDGGPYAEAPLVMIVAGTLEMWDARICNNFAVETYIGAPGVLVASEFAMLTGETADFIMHGGQIDGNIGYGGVVVTTGGTFTMEGGDIKGNKSANEGGGVMVGEGGTFILNGGTIEGNAAAELGGGVLVYGTFKQSGGTIIGNEAEYDGGGVMVVGGGIFTMNSGNIMNNKAVSGSGVLVNGEFTLNGGTIGRNNAFEFGGGVLVDNGGIFTLDSGYIEGNEAGYGGQVYVGSAGFFEMKGGTLSGKGSNADYQAQYGAGVYIASNGIFAKEGGTIYGSSPVEGENNLRASMLILIGNASYLGGNAVCYYYGEISMTGPPIDVYYVRNSTLGLNDSLSTAAEKLPGNWEYNNNLP